MEKQMPAFLMRCVVLSTFYSSFGNWERMIKQVTGDYVLVPRFAQVVWSLRIRDCRQGGISTGLDYKIDVESGLSLSLILPQEELVLLMWLDSLFSSPVNSMQIEILLLKT